MPKARGGKIHSCFEHTLYSMYVSRFVKRANLEAHRESLFKIDISGTLQEVNFLRKLTSCLMTSVKRGVEKRYKRQRSVSPAHHPHRLLTKGASLGF